MRVMYKNKAGQVVESKFDSYGEFDETKYILINGFQFFPDSHYSIVQRLKDRWGYSISLIKTGLRYLFL